MELSEMLLAVANFDPVLVGIFAGLAMLYVQTLKPIWSFAEQNPRILVLGFTMLFSVLIVLEAATILKLFVLNYLLLIATTGIYEGAKTTEKEDNLAGL